MGAGYTLEDGKKTIVADPELVPNIIICDSKFALETPQRLWLSTAIRSRDFCEIIVPECDRGHSHLSFKVQDGS